MEFSSFCHSMWSVLSLSESVQVFYMFDNWNQRFLKRVKKAAGRNVDVLMGININIDLYMTSTFDWGKLE
jgi:hypothetical protein